MKHISNLVFIIFAFAGVLVYKSIIPLNIFVYGYTYTFILYMLYQKSKSNSKVNVKVFPGIWSSLLGLFYTTPYNNMTMGITLLLLAYLAISNLIIYIKDYNSSSNDNSFPIVALSSLMIVLLYLLIAMKMLS